MALVQLLVERDLGWIFREQPVSDYGIDAHIEIVEDGQPTGRLIGVQVKSGQSYFSEEGELAFVFRGDRAHLDYWALHSLPVIVALCDVETGACYWQAVHDNVTRTKAGWKMSVPRSHRLGESARSQLSDLSGGGPYRERLRQLQLAKPWMEAIEKGARIFLEAEEWINKTMSRGSLRILAEDAAGSLKIEMDWPFVMFPREPWAFVFPRLFPWAEFHVDDETYHDLEWDMFVKSEGVWDSEDQEYKFVDVEDFEKWRRTLATIRPYRISAGEVAYFRLELSISSLGKSFLELDRYFAGEVAPEVPTHGDFGEYAFGLKMLAYRYIPEN